MPATRQLLIEAPEPFVLHHSRDGWRQTLNQASSETCFGLHVVKLTAEALTGVETLDFTFYYPGRDSWEGHDFVLARAGDQGE